MPNADHNFDRLGRRTFLALLVLTVAAVANVLAKTL